MPEASASADLVLPEVGRLQTHFMHPTSLQETTRIAFAKCLSQIPASLLSGGMIGVEFGSGKWKIVSTPSEGWKHSEAEKRLRVSSKVSSER